MEFGFKIYRWKSSDYHTWGVFWGRWWISLELGSVFLVARVDPIHCVDEG